MFIKRRINHFQLIKGGKTYSDKLKLTILALFYLLPNRYINPDAQTPQWIIDLTKHTHLKINNIQYELIHPRQLLMVTDDFEHPIQHWFNQTGVTFLDIGANIGKYSIMLSPHFKEIYSFEPTPETYKVLEHNIKENNLTNIHPVNLAAWNEKTTLTFHLKNNPGGNSAVMEKRSHGTITINAILLDSLIHRFTKVDLIKMDIEGAEPQALQGMTKIIKRDHPIMIIEIIEENQKQVYKFLEQLGYNLVEKQKRNHLWKHSNS